MGAQGGRKRPADRKVPISKHKNHSARERAEVTSISNWKKKSNLSRPQGLTVPSGNTCLVRRKPLDVFLKAGKVPQALAKIVQDHIAQNEGDLNKPFDVENYEWNADQLRDAFEMMDLVIVECVVEPQVLPIPENEGDRDPDLLYIDEVDYQDRVFIFQFVIGGTSDLDSFREQSATTLAGSSHGQGIPDKAK